MHVPQIVQVDVLLIVMKHAQGFVLTSALIYVILLVQEDVNLGARVDAEEDGSVPVVVQVTLRVALVFVIQTVIQNVVVIALVNVTITAVTLV